MNNILNDYVSSDLLSSVQNLVAALLVLLIGWLIAKGIASGIGKAIQKMNVEEKVFSKPRTREQSLTVHKVISKGIYYILLLVVFIIFFNILNLNMIASPLSGLITTFLAFLPAVLKAGLLLLLAWCIAFAMKWLIVEGSKKVDLSRILYKIHITKTEEDIMKATEKIGTIAFYFILLLFIPGVLESLSIGGMAEPFSALLDTILAFIPKLLMAVMIVAIGWIIAKVMKSILVNLLQAFGVEKLTERLKLENVFANGGIASFVGNVAFVLIMIPVVISALEKLELAGIADPAISMLDTVIDMIPNVIIAVALVLVGVWIGKVIGGFVRDALQRIGFNKITSKINVQGIENHNAFTPSTLVGYIVQVLIVFFLAVQALYIIKLDFLVGIASTVTAYLPFVLAAILILGVALIVANIVERTIMSLLSGPAVTILAGFAKYGVVVLAVFMALTQLGIATTIVNASFIITLSGLALAFGLAFGLGGKDFANKNLRKLDETIDQTTINQANDENNTTQEDE